MGGGTGGRAGAGCWLSGGGRGGEEGVVEWGGCRGGNVQSSLLLLGWLVVWGLGGVGENLFLLVQLKVWRSHRYVVGGC